ncbi:cytochrome c oxidase assembly protein subunit 15 [Glutamicibacter mysorens]|uniref:Cytochrome c oxidase assembly protein subunit 15 n=1 Tax=Glutamicibacter mysorens TaxID=257984 RepID=A0ABX4MXF7_9MICC|nr:cytochrome c oxidase assembly protein subunit 15 [Glutamicibacter mysorens]
MTSVQAKQSWADKLPTKVNRLVHGLAIASLISQIGIIVTGGAVRLTESGLGCSHWPNCVPGSMTPVPEMGIHGIIEFGNRLLTFVLLVIAVAFLVSIWKMRPTHRTLYKLAVGLLAGIALQALVGAITVWTGLNAWVVSVHFLISGALVIMATFQVNRTTKELKSREIPRSTKSIGQISFAAWVFSLLAVAFGTVVTGTGPHAGDADAPRHLFDPLFVTRLHTAPVYLLVAATVVVLILAYKQGGNSQLRNAIWWLVAAIAIQAAIGYIQHFNGLPVALVLSHMLGASLLLSASANVWDWAAILPGYRVIAS